MLVSSTRKIFIAFLFATISTALFGQGCAIDSNNFELISPVSENLPCIERNVPYSATIHLFALPTLAGYPIDSILITTFLDLPTGITYSLNPNPGKLYPYDHGCVHLSGTTSDTAGSYVVDYNGYLYLSQGSPSFDYLRSAFPGVLPEYSLKVIEPGASCPNTPSAINPLSRAAAFSVYPNPSNGIFSVEVSAASAKEGELSVSDVTGRIIYSQNIAADYTRGSINLSTYPKGLYQVQLKTTEGISAKNISIE
jgi:hypothetical protein